MTISHSETTSAASARNRNGAAVPVGLPGVTGASRPAAALPRDRLLRILYALTRAYLRSPITSGKRWLWRHWVRPYLDWRSVALPAATIFGKRMLVTFPEIVDSRIYFFGIWEPTATHYFLSALKPGDVFIDVGAHEGYYSLLAASRVGRDGRVYAFEASPSTYANLCRNVALNDAQNIVARNAAVTDAPKTVSVFRNERASGSTSILPLYDGKDGRGKECTVEGAPLPTLLDPEIIRAARVIKIDTEGAEWLVVNGMGGLLERLSDRAEVLVEIDERATRSLGHAPSELIQLFEQAGFSAFWMPNSYRVEDYIAREPSPILPYDGAPFAHADILFRRSPR